MLFLLNRTYVTMEELLADYISGALHPGDVKPALTKAINQILQVKYSSQFCRLNVSFPVDQ
jgi:hypothetical protein